MRLVRTRYLTYHDQLYAQIAEQTDYSVPLDGEATTGADNPAAGR
ncbi:hypothetical protein [Corynebacterium halotolerans]